MNTALLSVARALFTYIDCVIEGLHGPDNLALPLPPPMM